ncbi:MAG: hypothetical protein JXI32_01675 [Deltaproteobacteria bacterium]|nr:hypothetical protein [Deltaproteobacteria bacterium]
MRQGEQISKPSSQESQEYRSLDELVEAINRTLQPGEQKLLEWVVSAPAEERTTMR